MPKNNTPNIEAWFLGTGTSQGVPVITCPCRVCQSSDTKDKRLRSSLLIKVNGKNYVIDAGPDFRAQMLQHKINALRAILITHEHVDHIFGLDDIRSFNWVQKRSTDIYAEERVQEAIKRIFDYVFADHTYPGIPKMTLHSINNSAFKIDETTFIPIRCFHHKLPVYGYRVGDLTYITDANHIADQELQKIKGTRILIINALRKEQHISHFNLEQALAVVRQINPEKAFLTHLSHTLGKHAEVQRELPEGVFLAYDGLKIQL